MRILHIFPLLVVSSVVPAIAQTRVRETSLKYQAAKIVFDRLVRASGSLKTPPVLVMTPGTPKDPGLLAVFDGDYVQFSEHVYDLCVGFKGSLGDCLSVLLGHELAHFYQGHLWKYDLSRAAAISTEIGSKLSAPSAAEIGKAAERRAIESQADYAGGLLAFQAGFNPTAYSMALMKAFYDEYQIKARETAAAGKPASYPTLEERVVIAELTARRLRDELYPVFEAGIRLSLVGNYSLAAFCFDFIGKTFTSREILNNAASAYIMQALDGSEVAAGYSYPVQFDFDTRLYPNAGGRAEVRSILATAQQRLEFAIQMDPSYAPAALNLAIVKSLQRQTDEARLQADKAYDLATTSRRADWISRAALLRGIVAARAGEKAKAEAAFLEAEKLGNRSVPANRKAIAGGLLASEPVREPKVSSTERIARLTAEDPQAAGVPSRKIVLRGRTQFDTGLELQMFGTPATASAVVDTDSHYRVFFVSTPPTYTGASAKGLRVGSSAAELTKLYGAPVRTYAARSGSYRLYTDPSLLVFVNAEDKVEGWTLYNIISRE